MELERRRVVAGVFIAASPTEWMSLRDIAKEAGWPESSALAVLARLERHGWVESQPLDVGPAWSRRCWRGMRNYRLTGQGVPGVRALVGVPGVAGAA